MDKDIFQKQTSILIKGTLLEGNTVDIAIDEQGRIAGVGEGIGNDFAGACDYVLDGSGTVAIPGLVNTHTHAAMSLLRGYADDMILEEWLTQKIWPLEAHLTADDVYNGTKFACLEMIQTGTIAFSDMYFFMEDAARAVDEMGMKANLSHGFIDLNEEDRREQEIRKTEDFCRFIRNMTNPRIQADVGPHAVYTVSQEGLRWLSAYAEEEKIGIHVHLSETEKEVTDCVAQNAMRPPALLDACGCLTSRTVAAHCCWLDRAECVLLASRGVNISHNPTSNMKLATDRAMPYHWLRHEEASVTLGTDGCASNNNLDIFEEMKHAALLQKFFWNDKTLLPAPEALRMATTAGAKALRLGPGVITTGAPADIVLMDRKAACFTPLHNATSNLVYACNGSVVKTVLCNGKVLMLDRFIPGGEEIRAEAEKSAAMLVSRAMEAE